MITHSTQQGMATYCPLLRCRPAERDALKKLSESVKDHTAPIIEVPAAPFGSDKKGAHPDGTAAFKGYVKDLNIAFTNRKYFVDMGQLPPDVRSSTGEHPVTRFWREATEGKLFRPIPVPVISLGNSSMYLRAVHSLIRESQEGLCLRLNPDEIEAGTHLVYINSVLSSFALAPSQVDVIVDFGRVVDNSYNLGLLAQLPYLQEWRTLISLAGAFRRDLTGLVVGTHQDPRQDWAGYENAVAQGRFPRVPIFGDYTIQYGQYQEPVNARGTASVRYTLDESWMIRKGELPNLNPFGCGQYAVHAEAICNHPAYPGSSFSAGDQYIYDIASRKETILKTNGPTKKGEGPGNPTTWLSAGMNRHITLTAQQTSRLLGA